MSGHWGCGGRQFKCLNKLTQIKESAQVHRHSEKIFEHLELIMVNTVVLFCFSARAQTKQNDIEMNVFTYVCVNAVYLAGLRT